MATAELKQNSKSEGRNSRSISVRHDQKLEFILRTAAQIFAEKSYHSSSMRDISRATNVSLAGLYHYCDSKEQLLFLIQDNCFGRVRERLEERLKDVDDPLVKLRVMIENHLSFFVANMAEMKVLSHEAESLRGNLREHVSSRKHAYAKLTRDILKEVQATRPNAQPVDLTVATYALFGMMNWIYNWYDPKGKLKVNDLAQNLTQLFLGGFLTESLPDVLSLNSVATLTEDVSIWRETNHDASNQT